MKKGLLLLMILLALCLCACGAEAPAEETAAEPAAEPEQAAAEETAADAASSFVVELKDAHRFANYEGVDILLVVYSFTNNSEDTISATSALYFKGFQDGVQIEPGYAAEDDLPEEIKELYNNDWKDIRPGTTIDCYYCFELDSESEVEVEVTDFVTFSDDLLAAKTYAVAQ
ncbi:MAG: DUF5067 domain-containing protein [Firmicutes bacterium]|nr:DUF5067 domain-containing protein [Bacillota bacterium]